MMYIISEIRSLTSSLSLIKSLSVRLWSYLLGQLRSYALSAQSVGRAHGKIQIYTYLDILYI